MAYAAVLLSLECDDEQSLSQFLDQLTSIVENNVNIFNANQRGRYKPELSLKETKRYKCDEQITFVATWPVKRHWTTEEKEKGKSVDGI